MATRTQRTFGKNRNLGDIIYNPSTKSVFCKINLGFFGNKTITLVKREDNCYDLMVSKYNSEETIKVGQTFPVKNKGETVEGLTQTTLGLFSEYDSIKQKNITSSNDGLFITTHKLKEPKKIGDKGFQKVGYITGKFGIEIEASASNDTPAEPESVTSNEVDYDDDNEVIPF